MPTTTNPELYERDFYAWIQVTAQLLKNQIWEEIDLANLIVEVESMGRAEKNALKSNLIVVLMHLLKYTYQPHRRSDSWLNSISEHRVRIDVALESSPSLKPYLEEVFASCYKKAQRWAIAETKLSENTFPSEPAFSLADALDLSFLPGSSDITPPSSS